MPESERVSSVDLGSFFEEHVRYAAEGAPARIWTERTHAGTSIRVVAHVPTWDLEVDVYFGLDMTGPEVAAALANLVRNEIRWRRHFRSLRMSFDETGD